MILKGPINFKFIPTECVNPCSEVALDMDVCTLYTDVHFPTLETLQGIHPTYGESFRRRYTASIDPASDNVVIVDHMPIIAATQRKGKSFNYESLERKHKKFKNLKPQQILFDEDIKLKITPVWINKYLF